MPQEKTTNALIDHLTELRKCLIQSLITLLAGFSVCVYFSKGIYQFLATPLKKVLPESSFFIATHPFEAWITYLKTALIAGLFLSSPMIFWLIWRFISPGLYRTEKKYSVLFVTLTSFFFIGGALFGYYTVFPFAFDYFISVTAGTDIVFLPQMDSYLGFAFRMLISFGLIFELPIIMTILSALGIVTVKQFMAFQRYMIVLAFVVGAILTPPDVITQTLMSIPIIILYELGVLLAWLFEKKVKTAE